MQFLRARRERGSRGAAAVEFALVFCFLILPVTFGTIQYGYQYWSLQTGSATAREAVRQLAVGRSWSTCVLPEATNKLRGPATSTITVTSVPADLGTLEIGDTVSVTVSFQSLYMGLFPLPNRGFVTQTASTRVENVPPTALGCT